MFKRFEVMDLFEGYNSFEVVEWVDSDKRLPEKNHGIFKVRLSNGDETFAYYCADKCERLIGIGYGSYWWDKIKKQPLYNVTHWGRTEEQYGEG